MRRRQTFHFVLAEEDSKALKFAVQHADLPGYSFVRTADDIRDLQTNWRNWSGESGHRAENRITRGVRKSSGVVADSDAGAGLSES
jgi:hypothetical protein